ncbi:MAG: hypothetical protein ACI4T3_04050 [Lactobacillus sp.]
MKFKKNILIVLSAILLALGCVNLGSNVLHISNQPQTVQAAIHHKKIWTSIRRKIIIGNRRSHIYHVYRQHSYKMNKSNAVYFKSEAAARAAGYRRSKR